MGSAFHEILSQLRKNKRVSQRKVAADLYISQALLSHYENGIREPGLDFVGRACDYYGVSADYILGRAETADGVLPPVVNWDAPVAPIDAGGLSSLLKMLSELDCEALSTGACRCLGAVSYRLLRHMAPLTPHGALSRLTIPENQVGPLSDAEMRLAEVQFLAGLDEVSTKPRPGGGEDKPLPPQIITLLSNLDEQIAKHRQAPLAFTLKETP